MMSEATVVDNLLSKYNSILEKADPRTRNWFLLWNSPVAVLVLFVFYILMVLLGKRFMKNRNEIYVSPVILFTYNMSLVVLSIYMFYELVVGAYQAKYDLLCAKLNVTYDKGEMRVATALWLYFVSKAVEFLDTFFMIIRKKFNQVTFLHCFHHSSMLLIWWTVCMFAPTGQSWFGPTLNSFVHVFMYAYYGLSVIPSLKDKLWWKKYITKVQLIQFFLALAHIIHSLYSGCDYPLWGQYLLTTYMIILIVLFSNFYLHEYIAKSNKRKAVAAAAATKKDDNNNNKTTKNGHYHESNKKSN